MIFCQYKYKEYNNETKTHPNEWMIMVRDNELYCRNKTLYKRIMLYIYVHLLHRCMLSDLPSFHWYWKDSVKEKKDLRKKREKQIIKECLINPDMIKFHFNATTTIEDLEKRL